MHEDDLNTLPAGGPVTRLHVTGDRIALEIVDGAAETVTLEIGSLQDILDHLRHEPATAAEIEAAIAEIEDALMPAMRALPARRCLVTSAAGAREIAAVAGLEGPAPVLLPAETVELLFNRLADVAHGMPAARLGMPPERLFAARLLLLRELLHHGGFDAVMIAP
jgi:hypothetical protein